MYHAKFLFKVIHYTMSLFAHFRENRESNFKSELSSYTVHEVIIVSFFPEVPCKLWKESASVQNIEDRAQM